MGNTFSSRIRHNKLSSEADINGGAEIVDTEQDRLLDGKKITIRSQANLRWHRLLQKGFVVVNGFLTLILILSISLVHNPELNCPDGPAPPKSPPRDDGVVRYINKEFKPDPLFQSEPSDEVDEAWDAWFRKHDKAILIPTERVEGLPETLDAWLDPGYKIYALAYQHQMHCVDYIRKSFYPERFFPNETCGEVTIHKYHCLDLIRQAILCHADVSLVSWWNDEYSYVDDAGNKQLTQTYLSKSMDDHYMNTTKYIEELGPTPQRPHHKGT